MNVFKRLWRRLGLDVVIRKAPLVGEVKNAIFVHGADFEDPVFGASRAMPTVLEIVVDDDEERRPANVGALVKKALFPHEHRFIFNVAFSCGDPGLFGRGLYTDPQSIWFNVFFGYYQLDVPRPQWERPFGYRLDEGHPRIQFDDVVRIGKADWNYFSSRVYGVPLDAIRPLDRFDMGKIAHQHLGRVRIGESWWDHVTLDGVEVVSAYTAPGEVHRLEDSDPLLSPIWRALFGRPHPRPGPTPSFVPTVMRAELYMAYEEGKDLDLGSRAWKTLIFGGTVRSDHPDRAEADRFLALQLAALRKVMAHAYARAGFATEATS
jgi:hypothetical protein